MIAGWKSASTTAFMLATVVGCVATTSCRPSRSQVADVGADTAALDETAEVLGCGPGRARIDGLCPPEGMECFDGNEVVLYGCESGTLGEFGVTADAERRLVDVEAATGPDGKYQLVWTRSESYEQQVNWSLCEEQEYEELGSGDDAWGLATTCGASAEAPPSLLTSWTAGAERPAGLLRVSGRGYLLTWNAALREEPMPHPGDDCWYNEEQPFCCSHLREKLVTSSASGRPMDVVARFIDWKGTAFGPDRLLSNVEEYPEEELENSVVVEWDASLDFDEDRRRILGAWHRGIRWIDWWQYNQPLMGSGVPVLRVFDEDGVPLSEDLVADVPTENDSVVLGPVPGDADEAAAVLWSDTSCCGQEEVGKCFTRICCQAFDQEYEGLPVEESKLPVSLATLWPGGLDVSDHGILIPYAVQVESGTTLDLGRFDRSNGIGFARKLATASFWSPDAFALAVSPQGIVLAAWADCEGNLWYHNCTVHMSLFDAALHPVLEDQQVNVASSGHVWSISAAAFETGEFILAWSNETEDGSRILAQRFDKDGYRLYR